jgi:LCP family protein required for cell wall assembly
VLALGVTVVASVLAAVAFVGWQAWKLDHIRRENLQLADYGLDEPQNWLIVGSDSRAVVDPDDPTADLFLGGGAQPTGARADTIMVVRIDPGAATVDVLSFPRDLWLPISGTGESERINTAYGTEAGPQRLVDTIRDNFGIDIHHYAEIDFRGFEGLVDAVGGVPLYFERAVRDPNSGLQIDHPGCVTLDGSQALAFARSRHLQYMRNGVWVDDPSGDLGRISRQQVFLRRVVDRSLGSVSGGDLLAVTRLVDVAVDNLTLDSQVDVDVAMALLDRLGGVAGQDIRTHELAVEPFTTDGGAAVLRFDEAQAQEALTVFGVPAPAELDPSEIAVDVVNGSGVPRQASQTTTALAEAGFDASVGGDSPESLARTEVRHAPGDERAGDLLAGQLAAGAELVEDDELAPGQLVLVTGADFDGVLGQRPGSSDGGSEPVPSGSDSSGGVTSTTVGGAADADITVGWVPGEVPAGVSCD